MSDQPKAGLECHLCHVPFTPDFGHKGPVEENSLLDRLAQGEGWVPSYGPNGKEWVCPACEAFLRAVDAARWPSLRARLEANFRKPLPKVRLTP